MRTLFASRPLLNADEFVGWARGQGFSTTLQPGDLHVTLAYSRDPLDWPDPRDDEVVVSGGSRYVTPLGDRGAVVLGFESEDLTARWGELRARGASWDYDGYRPHVTITWQGGDIDLDAVEPYTGDLRFGPERFRELDDDWMSGVTEKHVEFDKVSRIAKVDEELGLVFGWAMVCKVNGQPFWDSQDDHIPEDTMLAAAADFMTHSRVAKEMHNGDQVGDFVFAFPITTETAKAMDLSTKYTGLMVAMRPSSEDVLQKFRDGTYTGFSIGGTRITDEYVD